MRLSFVLPEVSARAALAPEPFDLEILAALASEHQVELFLDQATLASEQLRHDGVGVHTSLKRWLWNEQRGVHESADQIQARMLARRHAACPFDAVVYSSACLVDFAWHEPSLRDVPRGVALGSGLPHDLRAIWEDPRLFAAHGRQVFSLTGLVSSADFLVTTPGAPGLGPGCSRDLLPPLLSTAAESSTSVPARAPPSVVAVAATGEGAGDLVELLTEISRRVSIRPGTIVVVIVRPLDGALRPSERSVLTAVRGALRQQVIVVPAGDDGQAAEWLGVADLIVAASRAELRIAAVADAMRSKASLLVRDDGAGTVEGSFPADARRHRRTVAGCEVLAWEPSSRDRRRQLERLDASDPDSIVLVHDHGRAGPGARLAQFADLSRVDFVVWGRPTGIFGQPDPAMLYPSALGVRAGALPALAEAFAQASTLWEFIQWAVQLEWSDRCCLMVVPGASDSTYLAVAEGVPVPAAMCGMQGLLPAPRFLPVTAASGPPATHGAAAEGRSLLHWAQANRWRERLRIALPWRWGLLERGMRNHW